MHYQKQGVAHVAIDVDTSLDPTRPSGRTLPVAALLG